MALGDYTPTPWANDTTPAITAATLGHIETKLDEIDSAFNTKLPAPLPVPYTSNQVGEWYGIDGTTNAILSVPAGGTWAYISWLSDDSTLAASTINRGIVAGGSQIQAAGGSGKTGKALIWRIQ